MLNNYTLLDTTDFELTRAMHALQQLGLEPPPKRHRKPVIHSRANRFDHTDFHLFYFRHSEQMTLSINAENNDHWLALPVRPDTGECLALLDQEARLDSHGPAEPFHLPAHAQSLGFCLKQEALQRYLVTYLGDELFDPLEFQPGFTLQNAAHRALALMVLGLVNDEAQGLPALKDGARVANFMDALVATMLLYCPHNLSQHMRAHSPAPAPHDVKRVLDYIHSYAHRVITLPQLVAVSGVPGRTLNQHFRAHTGLSPMAYLRRTRLRNAYRQLSGADAPSVTEVALACGIAHLGRFSQVYRDEFGELPSETAAGGRA